MTFSDIERLQSITTEADDSLQMNPDTFRVLYEATARPLWVFLWRRTGDTQLADDLLQETFYRFLKARANHESDAHRRNYLFRIAANLATDSHRRKTSTVPLPEEGTKSADHPTSGDTGVQSGNRTDLHRAMNCLSQRQRDALWLAYAEGSSHQEIAAVLGVRTSSIKLILFRARRKLAGILRGNEGKKR